MQGGRRELHVLGCSWTRFLHTPPNTPPFLEVQRSGTSGRDIEKTSPSLWIDLPNLCATEQEPS